MHNFTLSKTNNVERTTKTIVCISPKCVYIIKKYESLLFMRLEFFRQKVIQIIPLFE